MRDKESKTPGQVGRFCYLVESSRKKANSLSPLNECPIVHFTSVFFYHSPLLCILSQQDSFSFSVVQPLAGDSYSETNPVADDASFVP